VFHYFTRDAATAWLGSLEELIEAHRGQAPHVTVRPEFTTNGPPYLTKLLNSFVGGAPPDVFATPYLRVPVYAYNKAAEPLEPLLSKGRGWSAGDYLDGLREAFSYGGQMVGVPHLFDCVTIAYNKNALASAGLRTPPATWSLDDFGEYATKLTVRQGGEVRQYGFVGPLLGGQNDYLYTILLRGAGGDLLDASHQKAQFNRPEAVAALEWMNDLFHKKQVAPDAVGEDRALTLPQRPFAMGVAALAFHWSSASPTVDLANPTFQWDVVMPPRKSRGSTHAGMHGWCLARGGKSQAAAVEFLRFAAAPESMARWVIRSPGALPPRKAVDTNAAWKKHLQDTPRMPAFWEAGKAARSFPPVLGWQPDAATPLKQAVDAVMANAKAARVALDEAAALAEAALAKARTQGIPLA
jgi:ABC-type glycerol-3-phosphate transport system substrate-binding protein